MTAWYAGLTALALALAYRGRGLGRMPGAMIIAGYLAFVTALAVTVEQGGVRPAAAVIPRCRHRRGRCGAGELAGPGRGPWRPAPGGLLAAGISAARMEHRPPWRLSLILCGAVAACDAASGPHLILIGLLIAGPCCALLTARWALTAAASGFAVALGIILGLPGPDLRDRHPVRVPGRGRGVGTTATVSAAVLQRQRP